MFTNYDINYQVERHYKKYLEKTIEELNKNGVVYVFSEEHVADIKNVVSDIEVTKVGVNFRLVKK